MTRPPEPVGDSADIDAAGWLQGTIRIPSPNQDDRPADAAVRLIVIHAISLPPGQFGNEAIVNLFTNRLDPAAHPYYAAIAALRVSAHFLIRRDGALLQFVPCARRAWHAGVSCWRGQARCNDFSLGIELEGDDHSDFTAAQYQALRDLLPRLTQHYPVEAIVGHSDIAPARKTDPGPHFEWRTIASR